MNDSQKTGSSYSLSSYHLISNHAVSYSSEPAAKVLDAFLQRYSLALPQDFIQFYQRYNGYQLTDADMQMVCPLEQPFGRRQRLEFSLFLAAEDILLNYDARAGVAFPMGTLPFIDVELGEIVISLRDDSFGKIYFCEADPTDEQLPQGSFEQAMLAFDPGNHSLPGIITPLANTFSQFLALLKIEAW